MQIIVCMKQILNQTSEDVRYGNINRDDLSALECALQIKDKMEHSFVTAVSMGPAKSESILKEAIVLGADEGILLSDLQFQGSDTLATATVLAAAAKRKENLGLIICGYRSKDGETGQTGPELAELLHFSFAGYISLIKEVNENSIICEKQTDRGRMIVSVPLPAVISVSKNACQIRNKSFWQIQKAQRQKVKIWTNEVLKISPECCGLKGSATQVIHTEEIPVIKRDGKVYQYSHDVAAFVLEQVFQAR